MAIKKASTLTQEKQKIPTENYIIFHNIGKVIVIPVDPDSINDQMGASFAENYPLSRSAPIYSYQHSGPRSIQLSFTLHRDLCRQFNTDIDGDPVDDLIRCLDAAVLPTYDAANKMVNPPVISVKIRDELYIKGVVTGSVSRTYQLPIINYGGSSKYAVVTINFSVSEITPYNASIIKEIGQYRS